MADARHDYVRQARLYDDTRRASPSIVRPLAAALDGSPGPRLLDVGGGTGNYAAALRDRGFAPVVLDVSPAMLDRAHAKGIGVVRAGAAALPVASESLDAVVMVSMLHLVPGWRAALGEARRVLRPGGRLALMLYAREHLAVHWVLSYFPSARAWVVPEHQSLAEVGAELPGARVVPLEFTDLEDASMAALCRQPHLLLDAAYRARTSFFERLAARDPEGLARGLERLARDLASGGRPDREIAPRRARYGDGAVVEWAKPL